jgi:hypothetical protein
VCRSVCLEMFQKTNTDVCILFMWFTWMIESVSAVIICTYHISTNFYIISLLLFTHYVKKQLRCVGHSTVFNVYMPCCLMHILNVWFSCNFTCFVPLWALATDRYFLYPEMLSPVGVSLSYFLLLCQETHCKCFMNSSKWFWCKIMFGKEHESCVVYTMFVPAQLLWNLCKEQAFQQPGWPWLECHDADWERVLHWCGRTYISFLYIHQWLLLGCNLNETLYIIVYVVFINVVRF